MICDSLPRPEQKAEERRRVTIEGVIGGMSLRPANGGTREVAPGHATAAVTGLAVSDAGRRAAALAADGTVDVWDRRARRTFELALSRISQPHAVSISPDGSEVAAAGADPPLQVADVTGRRPAGTLARGYPAYSVAFGPDGRTLAAGMIDGRIRLWDAATRRSLPSLPAREGPEVSAVAFSPDGTTLASGDAVGDIALRDLRRHKQLGAVPHGHRSGVTTLWFSANGRTLVSAGADRSLRLWDVGERRPFGDPLIVGDAPVLAVAGARRGQLVSADARGSVLYWDRLLLDESTDAWRRRICRMVGRSPTQREWQELRPNRHYDPICRGT